MNRSYRFSIGLGLLAAFSGAGCLGNPSRTELPGPHASPSGTGAAENDVPLLKEGAWRLVDRLPAEFSKTLPFRVFEGPIAAGKGGFYLIVDQYRYDGWNEYDPCLKSFEDCRGRGLTQSFLLLFDAAGNGIRSLALADRYGSVRRVSSSLLVKTPRGDEQLVAFDGRVVRDFGAASPSCLGVSAHQVVDGCDGKSSIDLYDPDGTRAGSVDFGGAFGFSTDTLDEDGSFLVSAYATNRNWLYRNGKKIPVGAWGVRTGPENLASWHDDEDSGFLSRYVQVTFYNLMGGITRQFRYPASIHLVPHRGGGAVLSAENVRGVRKVSASGEKEWTVPECLRDSFASGWTLVGSCGGAAEPVEENYYRFVDPAGKPSGGSLRESAVPVHPYQDIPEGVVETSDTMIGVYDGRGALTAAVPIPLEHASMRRLAAHPLSHARLAVFETDVTDDPRGANNQDSLITVLSIAP